MIDLTNASEMTLYELGLSDDELALVEMILSRQSADESFIIKFTAEQLTADVIEQIKELSKKQYKVIRKDETKQLTFVSMHHLWLVSSGIDENGVVVESIVIIDNLLAFALGMIDKHQLFDNPFFADSLFYSEVIGNASD